MLGYIIFLSQGQQISSTEVVLEDSQYQKTFCTATVITHHLFLSLSHSLSHSQNLNLTFLFNSPYPFSLSAVMLFLFCFPERHTHTHSLQSISPQTVSQHVRRTFAPSPPVYFLLFPPPLFLYPNLTRLRVEEIKSSGVPCDNSKILI